MAEYLNKIRKPHSVLGAKIILYPLFMLLFGIMLGVLTKALDETASNLLLPFIKYLDLGNFFSRMTIWIFMGFLILIYSKTPIRAGINVLLFFTGMVSSYYFYTVFIVGFFPKSYIMILAILVLRIF